MDMDFLTGTRVSPRQRGPFPSPDLGLRTTGAVWRGFPLPWDTGPRCVETRKCFPTWRCAFSRGGVFSHVQGEVFFCRPGHMLAPSKNFCGDLFPRILFPHAFSHLLPPPTPWRPWKCCVLKQ